MYEKRDTQFLSAAYVLDNENSRLRVYFGNF